MVSNQQRAGRCAKRRRKGIAIIVTALSLVFVIPMAGLAIDAGVLYTVKARLQSAVDAGALAAARSLSVGLTLAEQEDSARARAAAFFDANYPVGMLASTRRNVNVDVAETGFRTRTVTVSATVDAPIYFMRMLGFTTTDVRATGRASRRDINLILVLDRSSSMQTSNSCEPMKAAARQFITMFANGRDRLALITYNASYFVNFPPAMDFKTSSPTLDSKIAGISCTGNTNSATAIMEGYNLVKGINEPGALNLIVFFTDGLPNGITAYYPVKRDRDYRYGYGADGTSTGTQTNIDPSPCRASSAYGNQWWNVDHTGATYSWPNINPYWNPPDKLGVINQWNNNKATGTTVGLRNPQGSSETTISDRTDCRIASNIQYMRRDIAYIPDTDVYNNSTRGNFMAIETFPSGPYVGKIRPDKPSSIGKASANATDNAAIQIRNDATFSPVIYSIGLGDPTGIEPPDETLMRRVANDPSSPIFDTSVQPGLYVYAPDNTKLNEAFVKVASEILRIAK